MIGFIVIPSTSLFEAQLKHNMSRAKLASKLIKYPNVEDYQLALVCPVSRN
jgi:hypothetical protein